MQPKGFTLIELLVVIAIIGLLTSFAMVNINSARKKAQAARTIAELRQIRQIIEFYFNDTGLVPPHDHDWNDECEKAIFISGGFEPKPAEWSGPYANAWPIDLWGGAYHWELYTSPEDIYSISTRYVPSDVASIIDKQIDDGNIGTGSIRYLGGADGRLESYYGSFNFPGPGEDHESLYHANSCNP